MSRQEELEKLEKERERHVTRIFFVGLEIAFIFAIPLAIAVVVSLKVGGIIKWIALAVAFVISWTLMIYRYRQVAQKMEGLDRDIKALRKELGITKQPEHKFPDEIEDELER